MIAAVLMAVALLDQGSGHTLTYAQDHSVPDWVVEALARAGVSKTHTLDAHLNPFCLRADFDGDGKVDFAAFLRDNASGKIGIAVVHRESGLVSLLGAGKTFPDQARDFSWVDAWTVCEKGVVKRGTGEGTPPKLVGDALLIFKTESSSALLWWSGREYRLYWQAD